jgi:glycine dehydrogenase
MIRERKRHYICVSDEDIRIMSKIVGVESLDELFGHIPREFYVDALPLPDELSYEDLQDHLEGVASKNYDRVSFIGDGLSDFKVHEIVGFVSTLRNLVTAYTPYQPERSQGTLITHWIYQCLLSHLTGFEAINVSLYDRSTAIYEAICLAVRLKGKKADTVIVSEGIFPGDMVVVETLIEDTGIDLLKVSLDEKSGLLSINELAAAAVQLGDRLAGVVFPQVNCLGLLEDVDGVSDLCGELGVKSVVVIDPMLLGAGGLKAPVEYGKNGVDIIVGEGQHLAVGPNFGGPGLGILGVRLHDRGRNDIRFTPGRFVGKARDIEGRDCYTMVLCTREQHIRKDKATSNICSNQAFIATLAGAAVLARGERGMAAAVFVSKDNARRACEGLLRVPGVQLAFPDAAFLNEFVLRVPGKVSELIRYGCKEGVHVGVDVSERVPGRKGNFIKISFSDKHNDVALKKLLGVFHSCFGSESNRDEICTQMVPDIARNLLRRGKVGLPAFSFEEVKVYYKKLNGLNVSPDDGCYPLGSCTMKYNPLVNEWAAELPRFTCMHPQAPIEDVQGCLEVLYGVQEWFKAITGLAGVCTQVLAGAQGELAGLKMFQAFHRDKGDFGRDVILIPKSAHGTNFATAAMAGFSNGDIRGSKRRIVLLNADLRGGIDMADLDEKIKLYGRRICGIMVTNPNTSGLFETAFKEVADKIHEVGGLVYMDGANMNAIAGWVDLNLMGVDAVHNNLHKTWSIPHGGGGPGDAIVAVSERLVDFLPGFQIEKKGDCFVPERQSKSIGSFHRHWGNFAHKVRCYAYLLRLGREGVKRMSALSVLSARYLFKRLRREYSSLPAGAENEPRMHEFILSLREDDFAKLERIGIPRSGVIPRLGKLFLDFGFHSPTVAWPEPLGMMIEPTESYSRVELDRFAEAVEAIVKLVRECPQVLLNTPYFTPVGRIDEVLANRHVCVSERLKGLPVVNENRLSPGVLASLSINEIYRRLKDMNVLELVK